MTIAYLNGQYLPLNEAKISPLDRGFLFGDGIYEVVPTYNGNIVGFTQHLQRMQDGLAALRITIDYSLEQWRDIINRLIQDNTEALGTTNIGVYLHVSRGTDTRRFHAYPAEVEATVFAFAFVIPPPPVADRAQAKKFTTALELDLRWRRCHIKSTALLGNVMHFQQGQDIACDETILYNEHDQITEASSCNVFIVENGVIKTPPLDHQLLPGITRHILLHSLRQEGIAFEECVISKQQLLNADEVWLTSSTKELAPVVNVSGQPIGNGEVGEVWQKALNAYQRYKFSV